MTHLQRRFPAVFLLFSLILLLIASAASAAGDGSEPMWQDVAEEAIELQGSRLIVPESYRTVQVNLPALTATLEGAPMEFTPEAETVTALIDIPLPDGRIQQFRVFESPVMHPELGARYPEIKTYTAKGIDDPYASGRVDLTPKGFHAMIYTLAGTFYVDPYSQGDVQNYVSYYKNDFSRDEADLMEELEPLGEYEAPEVAGGVSSGPTLRTHRLALAATGEYSIFHGGTKPLVLAEMVTAVNRVTGIYEREVAVRMELIPNNDLLIFLDPNTDPYTNNNGGAMLGQNQATVDSIIGSANYDIGHVFSTGGGGVAYLGVVCNNSFKAGGVTGLGSPVGDPFYVDYVAHEMGHQYGGNHTFNGSAGACSGGNRNGPTAYEPGSGSTIMAYAGICGSQDTQDYSDDYFHNISFEEIVLYTTVDTGATCGSTAGTGNNPPTVDAGSGGFFIPIETPFTLTGSASDPDTDPLTYNWEEFDLGPAGHPNSPSGNAPIFRSFLATTSPSRTFPRLDDLVNNNQTIGELLPTYSRDLTFRLTVRDNHVSPSAGGVAYDTIAFQVTADAGPFLVTVPNSDSFPTWPVGTLQPVNWDVANTDAAPVNCSTVDILLSTDGGYSFPHSLAADVPNDGSELVAVPNLPTMDARVKVACASSIFFDISDYNFIIDDLGSFAQLDVSKSVQPEGDVAAGEPLSYTISVQNQGNLTATTQVTDTFAASLTNVSCEGVPGDLTVNTSLEPGQTEIWDCTVDVDPSIAVEIDKQVDQSNIITGSAVTYTITISNPNAALTLENVTVADPDVGSCTPSLNTPITLPPLGSQSYVCPNNILYEDTTNTATVSAEFLISNTASAAAPEDSNSPVESNTTETTVLLLAESSASVTIEGATVYLPLIHLEANGSTAAALLLVPLGGAAMLLLGGRRRNRTNRTGRRDME